MSPSFSRKVSQPHALRLSQQAHRLTLLWHQARAAEQAYIQALAELAPAEQDHPSMRQPPVHGILDATYLDTIYEVRPVHVPGISVPSFEVHHRPILGTLSRLPLTEVSDVIPLAREIYARHDDDQEHFVMLACDASNQVYAYKVIASGSLAYVDVDPGMLFRHAQLLGAHGVVLMHNHPSGNPEPSPEDLQLTLRLSACGSLVNCPVLDHIIIGQRGRYLSLREHRPTLWPRH